MLFYYLIEYNLNWLWEHFVYYKMYFYFHWQISSMRLHPEISAIKMNTSAWCVWWEWQHCMKAKWGTAISLNPFWSVVMELQATCSHPSFWLKIVFKHILSIFLMIWIRFFTLFFLNLIVDNKHCSDTFLLGSESDIYSTSKYFVMMCVVWFAAGPSVADCMSELILLLMSLTSLQSGAHVCQQTTLMRSGVLCPLWSCFYCSMEPRMNDSILFYLINIFSFYHLKGATIGRLSKSNSKQIDASISPEWLTAANCILCMTVATVSLLAQLARKLGEIGLQIQG